MLNIKSSIKGVSLNVSVLLKSIRVTFAPIPMLDLLLITVLLVDSSLLYSVHHFSYVYVRMYNVQLLSLRI